MDPQTQTPWTPLDTPISSIPPLSISASPTQILLLLLLLLTTLSLLLLALYRLHLHPLSPFPGPRHAALTSLLEFHDNVLRSGRFVWRIQAWHQRYGPIIRIAPNELHISDPSFHAQLYVGGHVRRTEKSAWHAKLFGSTATTVGTVAHETHRERRAPLERFFKRANVVGGDLEGVVLRGVGRLGEVLRRKARGKGECVDETMSDVVNLSAALAACSADIVGACALGDGFGLLEREDLGEKWWRLMLDLSRNTHLMKHCGLIYTLFTYLPQRLVALLHPLTTQLFAVQNSIKTRIIAAKTSLQQPQPSPKDHHQPQTLLHTLLTTSSSLHPTTSALADELFTHLGAATLSTSHALSVLLYHIHAHPPHLARLRAELVPLYTSASDSRPTLATLQSLPFLTACINEALRLSHGVAGRLPRVAPDRDILYTSPSSRTSPSAIGHKSEKRRSWRIPKGTTVSMTHMFAHLDEAVFQRARDFVPERWMEGEGRRVPQGRGMSSGVDPKRHFTPFGRGSRACVGREVAMAVMAGVVGEVVAGLWLGGGGDADVGGGSGGERNGDGVELQLYHTGREEVEVGRDWFGGVPEAGMGCKGVRVRVVRRREEGGGEGGKENR
ncbi:cytochrome P450 [Phyllosticta paracitricarpa]|uniref:Cytochrome P450 n=1 Tax=Phyllosticta paracitricarpa TaxID=2016321 RepID=A0ABR1N771_9PEZI